MFWGESCPTAWTMEAAKENPAAFDLSTDIQSVNMFFEQYTSQLHQKDPHEGPQRGLKWIFEHIAEDRRAEGGPEDIEVTELLREMEIRSITTNLTRMVPPSSQSMEKVREALTSAQTSPVSHGQLQYSYDRAFQALDQLKPQLCDKRDSRGQHSVMSPVHPVDAAREYAQLYCGPSGVFREAGCTEFFPEEPPFCGPRLDKRSILMCMAKGSLQGGPTADVLVLLAMLLFLDQMDPNGAATARQKTGCHPAHWCTVLCSQPKDCAEALGHDMMPSATRELFRLVECRESCAGCFFVDMVPGHDMGGERTQAALTPLVDAAVAAIISGARRLYSTRKAPPWGHLHHKTATF